MKLLGAREFIKMPAGTFYIPYWEDTVEECFKIIDQFKKNPKSFLELKTGDLHVFGDNSGSMSFEGDKEDNYIFYYDANVVGDADPENTLYLVIDENELPDSIPLNDSDNDKIVQLAKKDVIKIKNIFVKDVYSEYKDTWAIDELDKLSQNGNQIVNVKVIV